VLPEAVDLTQGPVVLQYDVRLQKGYDCGGAYLKFLMPQVRAAQFQVQKDLNSIALSRQTESLEILFAFFQ
jgi:hypothetical protein